MAFSAGLLGCVCGMLSVVSFFRYCKGVAFGRASTLKKHISVTQLKIKRS